jgi:hypothetical protein
MDDVGAFNDTWEEHLKTLKTIMARLQDNNFTINPLKCEWAVQETDWLGYWLTLTGLKPWKKKIEAILAIKHPQNIKEVRSFIGAVTFYRNMFPHRSHILTPLTALTKKPKANFIWTPEAQKAFNEMKAIIAIYVLLRYPDHNEEFHVITDASDYQLGTVIKQNDIPVAFYSRKLNPAQQNYTIMEKYLLSIIETLKEFRTMLYGCKSLHVHTDHRNLTYITLNPQRVLRWRLFLEEYNPIFHYIKGTENTLADALSRLPRSAGIVMLVYISTNCLAIRNQHQLKQTNRSLRQPFPSSQMTFLLVDAVIATYLARILAYRHYRRISRPWRVNPLLPLAFKAGEGIVR